MEMSNQTNNVVPNLFRELRISYTAVEASPGFSAAPPANAHPLTPLLSSHRLPLHMGQIQGIPLQQKGQE